MSFYSAGETAGKAAGLAQRAAIASEDAVITDLAQAVQLLSEAVEDLAKSHHRAN